MNEKNFEKINIKTVISIWQCKNKHLAMYRCTKFQLIWRTSDFGNKFAQKNVSDKNFGKINIKYEMRIEQCTSVSKFCQFGELQFLRPNFPQKSFRVEC